MCERLMMVAAFVCVVCLVSLPVDCKAIPQYLMSAERQTKVQNIWKRIVTRIESSEVKDNRIARRTSWQDLVASRRRRANFDVRLAEYLANLRSRCKDIACGLIEIIEN
ncbi:uncharacterized protein [Watersipora subatra]|uniref:uncharacterized protein isoform X2 n=1 Tax=Watersipora subatra TaxID=2589382 RepID=UPI00355AD3FC